MSRDAYFPHMFLSTMGRFFDPFLHRDIEKINIVYYGICYVWVLPAGNQCLWFNAQGVKWAMLSSTGVPHMGPGVGWAPIIKDNIPNKQNRDAYLITFWHQDAYLPHM